MTDAASVEAFLLTREQFGMRFGLQRMRRLLTEVGDPQSAIPAVHVVGTNGKSSTTLMIAAALRAQRLKTGGFTSPHLLSFRERIDIGGAMIDEAAFVAAAGPVVAAIERFDSGAAADDRVTQFEAIAAIAFVAFIAAGLDAIVVEAGLGGRLDATNVLGDSRVQVLTGVGIDHTQYLGETIEEIAAEKVAVVRSGAVMVAGELGQAAHIVANRMTDERNAQLIELREEASVFDALPGAFVRRNASLALAAAEVAYGRIADGIGDFDRAAATAAVVGFAHDSRLLGRLQIANLEPLEVRDSAHNEQAAEALVDAVREIAGDRPVTLLVAMLADKHIDETLARLLEAVAADGVVVCTQTSNPRAVPAGELAQRAAENAAPGVRVETEPAPLAALDRARAVAGQGGLLAVAGSNYLLADLLRDPSAPAGATL
ncbi:MAG: bifunctional folylpolyglutamate synthase/dihydrofolate synthase [Solirubrobacterales bacterium]